MSVVDKINEFPQFKLSCFSMLATGFKVILFGTSPHEEFTRIFNERFFNLAPAAREEIRLVQKGVIDPSLKITPKKATAKKIAEMVWKIFSNLFFQLSVALASGYLAYGLGSAALGLSGELATAYLSPILTSFVSASTIQTAATILSYKWTLILSSAMLASITGRTSLGKWVFKPLSSVFLYFYIPSILVCRSAKTSFNFIRMKANEPADLALGKSLMAAREKWVAYNLSEYYMD